jgi:hypothetical protein
MTNPWLDPAGARERAAAARVRAAQTRERLRLVRARARREVRRADALVAEAELARGRGLHWEEPGTELERVLVPIDGGQSDPIPRS